MTTEADNILSFDWTRDQQNENPAPAAMAYEPWAPVRNPLRNIGRNDPCPCGSGKKYKKCCG